MKPLIQPLLSVAAAYLSIMGHRFAAWAIRGVENHGAAGTKIDPGILPLVKAMNGGGRIRTVDSCMGHIGTEFSPYVSFHSSVRIANRLDALVRNLVWPSEIALNAPWMVVGLFHENLGLTFRLFSPTYDHASQSLWSSFVQFGLRRDVVDHDIRAIAAAIEGQLLMDGRGNKDPN